MVETKNPKSSNKRIAVACVAIFLVAFGIRLMSLQDTRIDAPKVQSGVVAGYQFAAILFRQVGFKGFFDPSGPLANPNLLGHPPGYPIVRAIVAALFGDSQTAVQYFQITCDALAAVLIFLIAMKLFPFAVGLIAGMLVALSPQFAWNSVLLLPDTLSVLPLLLAIYFLASATQKPRIVKLVIVGALVGLSCWLRANALLLAPFLTLSTLVLFPRGLRLRCAAALLTGTICVVAPITIRNWIVHHDVIPLSLGAGQTMLEGIADYDSAHRFGIPETDMGIMKMEAEEFGRPDYYSTLFEPDGVKRERMRLARAGSIAARNPVWFAGVMVQRAGSMLRLERARLTSTNPPVSHDFANVNESQRVWFKTPGELVSMGLEKSPSVKTTIAPDGRSLEIVSDNSMYGVQLITQPIPTRQYADHVITFPVVVDDGRMRVDVIGEAGTVQASTIIDKDEVKAGLSQPVIDVTLPFVSTTTLVRLAFSNAAPRSGHSVVTVGSVALFELGPASYLWTYYLRVLVRTVQRFFITAVMLPLSLLGIVILVRRRAWQTLVLMLSIPAYYLCFQSMLHTEYRYVMAIHYFLFIMVALSLYEIGVYVQRRLQNLNRVQKS